MLNPTKDDEQNSRIRDNRLASDSDSTLLPMLVGGLVLIIVSMVVVMIFV